MPALELPNLISGGNLNLTLFGHDIWGGISRMDSLSPLFINKFEVSHVVDIELVPLKPTWRNGRQGEDGIVKGLDQLLVSESLMGLFDSYRSWVAME